MENFNYKVGEVLLCDLYYAGYNGIDYIKGVTCEVAENGKFKSLRPLTHVQYLLEMAVTDENTGLISVHDKDIYTLVGLENE